MTKERDALVGSYFHLAKMPRANEALRELQKIASLVKPIMRNRSWHIGTLAEFFPDQKNLLGLNLNRGQKICLRLRYAGDQTQFLPLDSCVDTILHELCHNVVGPHNEAFHKLWNELRDEYTDLKVKGYTGEGFLSEGQRLGGTRIPQHEMRRQQRLAADRSHSSQKGFGQRLGGMSVPRSADIRTVITDAVNQRRQMITQGCGSGNRDRDERIANQAMLNGFKTQAEEDQANDRAIAEALWELAQQDKTDQNIHARQQWPTEGLQLDREQRSALPSPLAPHKRSYSAMDPKPSSWFEEKDDQRDTRLILDKFPPTTTRHNYPGTPRPESGTLGDDFVPPLQPPGPRSQLLSKARPRPQVFMPDKGSTREPPPVQEHPAFRPSTGSDRSSDHSAAPSVSSVNSSNPTMSSPHPSAFASPIDRHGRRPSVSIPATLQTTGQQHDWLRPIQPDITWTCPSCTLVNPESYLSCDACMSPRPCLGTIDDFSSLQDMGPDVMPTKSPTSPAELPGSGPALLWGDSHPGASIDRSKGSASTNNAKLTATQRTARSLAAATQDAVPMQERKIGWKCGCGAFMEDVWWCCSACGTLKKSS